MEIESENVNFHLLQSRKRKETKKGKKEKERNMEITWNIEEVNKLKYTKIQYWE